VEVTHLATGRRWDFGCYDWIDEACGYQRTLALEAVSRGAPAAPRPRSASPRRDAGAGFRERAACTDARPQHEAFAGVGADGRAPHYGPYAAAAAAPSDDSGGADEEEQLEAAWAGGQRARASPGVRMVGRAGRSYDRSLDGGGGALPYPKGSWDNAGDDDGLGYERARTEKSFRQGATWVPDAGLRRARMSSAAYYS
jgi:hypothetical protein